MGYSQDDLNRLIKYAQGLGLKVTIKDYVPRSRDAGYWDLGGDEITLFKIKGGSVTDLVLVMLHELAHHMSWIYDGRVLDPRFKLAIDKESERKPNDPPIPKLLRKAIYIKEMNDTNYQEAIAFEVGLKIPKWKMELEREFDIWVYKCFYETGEYPVRNDNIQKRRELRSKYGKK
jgi:hypothetical protein